MKKKMLLLCAVLTFILSFLTVLCYAVTFEITLQTEGNGALQAEKLRVHPFESVRIRAVPNIENGEHTEKHRPTAHANDMTEKD